MNTGTELGLCLSLDKARLWWRRICTALANNFIERGQTMSALRLLCRLEADTEEEVCMLAIYLQRNAVFVIAVRGIIYMESHFPT